MNKRRLRKAVKRISNLPFDRNLFLYFGNKIRYFNYKAVNSTRVAWPSNIMLELSGCCNLSCTTCPREYDYGKAMDKGFMDQNLAKKIIDESWPYLDSIGLTGMGETLLYRDLPGIIDYIKAKNRGIIISISTNAQVSGFREQINGLVNKVDTIQISADGLGAIYELIRKKASFRVFDENIKYAATLCRGSATDIMLNMVVTKENYMQMPLIVKYASESGIQFLDFTQLNLAALTGIDRSYYEFYGSDEFQGVFSTARETAESLGNVIITAHSFEKRTDEKGFRNCAFPWSHFYITWDGYLVPCCAKPFPKEMNFGNIVHSGLLELLNNDSYRSFRKLWFENKTPEFCTNCHYNSIK
ncbi:MAG TPA: radical SAM protein [Bacteroidales bacterium]|jgi:radical SAM protein with 4Fe4S-binding SPASM domain|nr:radical SAM protein [Bacteroidales bacterium]